MMTSRMDGVYSWRVRGGVAACLLPFALLAGCRSANSRKMAYLRSGERYQLEGKPREAAIQFSNAVRLDPGFAQGHLELSGAYQQTGANELAIYELGQVLQVQPENLPARLQVGQLLLMTGRVDDAAAQARWIVFKEPTNAGAYALLSAAEQAQGKIAEALRDIRAAIKLVPDRSEYHASLGTMLAGYSATRAESATELKTAIRLDGKNVQARSALALLLQTTGDLRGAEEQMRLAIAAAPASVQARAGLAALYLKAGDVPHAEETIRQATDQLADNPAAAPLLASFFEQTGHNEQAPAAYEAVVARHPGSLALRLAYIRALEHVGSYDTARQMIDTLFKEHPYDPGVIQTQAAMLMRDGKNDVAIELLQTATKSDPDDAALQALLGSSEQHAGNVQQAGESFGKALQIDPQNLEAQRGLAGLAFQKGDASGLRESARQMLLHHPDLADGYQWRGMANLQEHKAAAAVADLQEAVRKDPGNSLAAVQLGLALRESGDSPRARGLFDRALQLRPDPAALAALTRMDLEAHHPGAAVTRIQDQLRREPNSSAMYDQLAQAQLAADDRSAASASAVHALQLDGSNRSAMQTFTQVQLAEGTLQPAVTVWQTWLEHHPGDAQALAVLGLLYQSAGDDAAAEKYYKRSLDSQPTQPEVSANLSALLAEHGGNLDVALSMAQKAYRARPTSATASDALGWIYFLKGLTASALEPLQAAAALDGNDAAVQYHLGMVLAQSGRRVDAVQHLQRAADLAKGLALETKARTELSKLS